ncbi:MAG: MFS transporter [Elusimicrobia bacterium]|nr:MFS transporter [Elusimicrobiota bacterium]
MKLKASHKLGMVLIFCYLVAWLDRMAINMTIPFIARDLNIGPEKIGWILSAFFLGYSIFQIPGGMLADRIGSRKVILTALAWWSAFTALTGAMVSLPAMLATRFFFGMGEGVFPASVWRILAHWFTKKNRATANAIIVSAIASGPALTPLIIAPVLAAWGWRWCFYMLGFCGIFCLILAYFTIANSIQESSGASRQEIEEFEADAKSQAANVEGTIEKATFRELLKAPIIWVLFSIALIFNITMYGWLTWLPSYLMKAKGLDLKATAWAASLPFMFATVGCISAGFISDKFFRGRRRFLVFGCQVIGGICLYAFTRVADYKTYMILQCAAGFLLFMACGAAGALTMILIPAKLMGSGSGFVNTGGQIGGFLTKIIIGYYIAYRGNDYSAGFDIMLGALVIAALVVIFGVREKPYFSRA